jgi:hypothetical protein
MVDVVGSRLVDHNREAEQRQHLDPEFKLAKGASHLLRFAYEAR